MGAPVRACLAAFDLMRAAPSQTTLREFVSAFEAQQPALLEAAGLARDSNGATGDPSSSPSSSSTLSSASASRAKAPAAATSDRLTRLSAEFAARVRKVISRCAQARDSGTRC